MTIARVFSNNRSQAIRIPKAAEFPPDVREVEIRTVGRTLVISPAEASWDDFFERDVVDLGPRPKSPSRRRSEP